MGIFNIWNTNNTNKASLTFTGSSDKTVDTNTVLQSTDSTASIANGKVVVDSSGNVGIGVVPSSWTLAPALDIKQPGVGIWNSGSNDLYIQNNAYYNNGWKYGTSSIASTQYRQNAGQHTWFTAPSGTTGNPITWNTAMSLDSYGQLGNTSTNSSNLSSSFTSTHDNGLTRIGYINGTDRNLNIRANTGYNASITFTENGVSDRWTIGSMSGSGNLFFKTGASLQSGTTAMTLNSSGRLLLGTTTDDGVNTLQVNGGASVSGNVGIGTSSPSYKLDIYSDASGGLDTYSGINLRAANYGYLIEGGLKQGVGGVLKISQNQNGTKTEVMRIDSSGNVLVGGTANSLSAKGIIEGTSGYTLGLRHTGIVTWYLNAKSDASLSFDKDGTESMRIDSSGILNVSSGIKINGMNITEVGNNANGNYTKFADGTLICQRFYSSGTVQSGGGSVGWTYPYAFISTPSTTNIGAFPYADYYSYSAQSASSTGVTLFYRPIPNTSAANGVGYSLDLHQLAIGRWK